MAQVYDCTAEFVIRQRLNYAKRMLINWGYVNVSVTLMPDENSDVGVSVVIVDNDSGASRMIDSSTFDNLENTILAANSQSTYR